MKADEVAIAVFDSHNGGKVTDYSGTRSDFWQFLGYLFFETVGLMRRAE